jgi:hypothetical protein
MCIFNWSLFSLPTPSGTREVEGSWLEQPSAENNSYQAESKST